MIKDIICHVCFYYKAGCPLRGMTDCYDQPLQGHMTLCIHFQTIEDDCAPD